MSKYFWGNLPFFLRQLSWQHFSPHPHPFPSPFSKLWPVLRFIRAFVQRLFLSIICLESISGEENTCIFISLAKLGKLLPICSTRRTSVSRVSWRPYDSVWLTRFSRAPKERRAGGVSGRVWRPACYVPDYPPSITFSTGWPPLATPRTLYSRPSTTTQIRLGYKLQIIGR